MTIRDVMKPEKVYYFSEDMYIDPDNKTLFINPWKLKQPVYNLSPLMKSNGVTTENIKDALEVSLLNAQDIELTNMMDSLLARGFGNSLWSKFCKEVLDEAAIAIPHHVSSPVNRNTAALLAFMNKQELVETENARKIIVLYQSVNAKFNEIKKFLGGEINKYLIRDFLLSQLVENPVTEYKEASEEQTRAIVNMCMQWFDLMIQEKLIPMNYRDRVLVKKTAPMRVLNVSRVLDRGQAYIDKYSNLPLTAKWLIYAGMRALIGSHWSFGADIIEQKNKAALNDTRIAMIARRIVVLDYM